MKAIAAVDGFWGIGKDGKLLVHIPEDMKFFKEMTDGNVVVMGRKTLESLPGGKPLPGRINIVLSSTMEPKEGIIVCKNVDDLLETIRQYNEEVFVIGGGMVYRSLLKYCETAYITRIKKMFVSDTFFPDLESHLDWTLEKAGEQRKWNDLEYRFCTYRNLNVQAF